MNILAILVAAGRGERMGGDRPKAFLDLGGQPVLLRAARALTACPAVDGLVAVVPEAEVEAAQRMLTEVPGFRAVTPGGTRRQDSVLAGLKLAPRGFDGLVLVHDAARPLVPADLVAAVIEATREVGAAVPLLPLHDTIKTVEGDRVTATMDRGRLAAAQTPQGFRFALLRDAYDRAFREDVALTDEAMAVERFGAPVAAVAGAACNRKLTTPSDLSWAEALLAAEGGA